MWLPFAKPAPTHEVRQLEFGNTLVLNTPWTANLHKLVTRSKVSGISIETPSVSKPGELAFLRELNRLTSLILIAKTLEDVSPLYSLPSLRSLKLDVARGTKLELARFPFLQEFVAWSPLECTDFKRAPRLERVQINGSAADDLRDFEGHPELKELTLLHSRQKSLHGAASLRSLHTLRLQYMRRLTSLEDAGRSPLLDALWLHSCPRLADLEPLRASRSLLHLSVSNCGAIPSLSPIKHLELDTLDFEGNTNILDGDLMFIIEDLNLEEYRWRNRPHYSISNMGDIR